MQLPRWREKLSQSPLVVRGAIVAVALVVLGVTLAARRPKTPDELELELVSRLGRLTSAVMARSGRRIAPLLDDSFTDEAGRDKPHAIARLTAAEVTPPIGYRPDRQVYRLSPDHQFATAKNTVRIFSNDPKTHRVTAADVTIITDWVVTDRGWLLHHIHRPITRPVHIRYPDQRAKA